MHTIPQQKSERQIKPGPNLLCQCVKKAENGHKMYTTQN